MKPQFQCAEPIKSPSNLTKYCAYHEILKLKISADTPWMLPPIERRFEDIRGYPTIIRTQNRHLAPAASETLLLYCKIQHFALRLSPKMSRNAAPATKSHPPTSPNTAPATQNESHPSSASHMKRHFQCAEPIKSPSNISKYCACHAKWMSTVLLYETSTLRNCYFTELVLCGTVSLPMYYFADLLLYWSVTLMMYYFADLLLYWSVTLLMCYFTELVLCGTVILPIYYFADLLLYRSVTLVMCYFTDLLLCGTVTVRNYYFTDLFL